MKTLMLCCWLFITAVTSQRVEIYDGNFYGIDDDKGVQTVEKIPVEDGEDDGSMDDDDVDRGMATPPQWGRGGGRGGGYGRGYHHRRFGHHHGPPPPMCRRYQEWLNMTEPQKMEAICQRLQAAGSDETMAAGAVGGGMGPGPGRGRGMMWKLQLLSEGSRQKVLNLMAQRKQSMLDCCAKGNTDDKTQCVKDMNAARYDRICSGQEPLCPMTAYRAEIEAAAEERGYPRRPPGMPLPEEMIRNTTDTCCAFAGEQRVSCFDEAANAHRQQMFSRMHGHHPMHGGPMGGPGMGMGMGPGGMGGPGMGMGPGHGMGRGMGGRGRGMGRRGRMGPPDMYNGEDSDNEQPQSSDEYNGRRGSRRYARRQYYRRQRQNIQTAPQQ